MPNQLNLTLTIRTTVWVIIVGILFYDKLSVFTLHLAVHVFLGGWEAEVVFLKKLFGRQVKYDVYVSNTGVNLVDIISWLIQLRTGRNAMKLFISKW